MQINYPTNLPISLILKEIKETIQNNQLTVISGETGSGKTTQLPKILYEMGYNLIGHTQPRRVAARTIANRISNELKGTTLVGYKVRFNDKTLESNVIKLMTDGVLLQEIYTDKLLNKYQALIIDEAHERSLNIDFILGYLKLILPKRPELKVIITSATIDNKKIAEFFNQAPIINIPGKTFPVDVIYNPYDGDINEAILHSIKSLLTLEEGNILVFLPGEREIKECHRYLIDNLSNYLVLLLYSHQNEKEQQVVFKQDSSLKVILATNIAETSLTIPGVKYVIDTGNAKVKRYSPRYRVEQLQVEEISKASCNQRQGRAGRLSHGICIRLFSEENFNLRAAYTDPEIIRSNLANVILKLLTIGNPQSFPLLDRPQIKVFNDGFRTLVQVKAIDENYTITKLGFNIVKIPIDVNLARIIIASEKNALKEILIIVAFLATQDPREYPQDKLQQYKQAHSKWNDKQSDFTAILNLWTWYNHKLQQKTSRKQFLSLCQKNFVSMVKLREWQELHNQIKDIVINKLKYKENQIDASYQNIHQALLSGLINNIGKKDENNYIGTNNKNFIIHPSSSIIKTRWLVSATLIQTTKLYARINAEIDPAWLLPFVKHLVKYNYNNEYFDAKRGEVVASQLVMLYGLLISQQKIAFAKIDPQKSREIFIKDALIAEKLNYSFIKHNKQVVEELVKLETKYRLSIITIEEELYNFYDKNIPQDVYSTKTLELWSKTDTLKLDINQFLVDFSNEIELYPNSLLINSNKIALKYVFSPGKVNDGVTAFIRIEQLNQIDDNHFSWLVPGLICEKVSYILKSLPKHNQLYPQIRVITEFLSQANTKQSFNYELTKYLAAKNIIVEDIGSITLPKHLNFHFQVVGKNNIVIAEGDDILKIKKDLALTLRDIVSNKYEIHNVTTWLDELDQLLTKQKRQAVIGYLSLYIEEDKIKLTLLEDIVQAKYNSRRGLIELMKLQLTDLIKYVRQKYNLNQASLYFKDIYNSKELFDDCINFILNMTVDLTILPKNKADFEQKIVLSRKNYLNSAIRLIEKLNEIAKTFNQIQIKIKNHPLYDSILLQLDDLVYPGFLKYTSFSHLEHFPRYLSAIIMRIDKFYTNRLDSYLDSEINKVYEAWYNYVDYLENKHKNIAQEIYDFKYKIEELRVSLFAENLKTQYTVSTKRLLRELEEFKRKPWNIEKLSL